MGVEFGAFRLEVWILQAQLKCGAPSEENSDLSGEFVCYFLHSHLLSSRLAAVTSMLVMHGLVMGYIYVLLVTSRWALKEQCHYCGLITGTLQ